MNTVLFDLDGTLLPIDQKKFLEVYFGTMEQLVESKGIDSKKMMKSLWVGTSAMINNDGSMSNEKRFWSVFYEHFGKLGDSIEEILDDYYKTEFEKAKVASKKHPLAIKCVQTLKKKGYQVALTTNPLFPDIATYSRIRWAGLEPEDFSIITTYENCTFSKPNIEYYSEILKKIDKKPNECIMIGNDVSDDMCVEDMGMDTFLLKDCLINSNGKDIQKYKQGNFDELYDFIKNLPPV
ncbi:MAG: HAD family hydrolase [Bacillota bacterium]|nr:HAD family hydrolase [Bacillota bacterium]